MTEPIHIAKSIIYYARKRGITDISGNKLQKLLYLVYTRYAKRTGRPLWTLDTPWITSTRGPLCEPVGEHFKMFTSVTISIDIEPHDIDDTAFRDISAVLDEYGKYPPWQLVDPVMGIHSPWYVAMKADQPELYFTNIKNL